ncbi:hypothetical protein HYDPIDRAFT_42420 [Hydnomerulius pinastri MD-312]|uniref:MYND-type domain-containing protein n=1 Tax=Hydnomerulius pinastri MD-312 TaxID=994086 RepID=A0A0C9WCL0_9AGAM|nr:hypothetical protein HYDPIDRAFT_42420 [Hydnomerulius pinastri MD-312]
MSSQAQSCNNCSEAAGLQQLMRCSRCKDVLYCSNACQIADWPVHKYSCKSAAQPTQGGPSQSTQQLESITGITIACEADRRAGKPVFQMTTISPSHPIHTRGNPSPLFSRVGLPIMVYRHLTNDPMSYLGNPDPGLDNQIATYLMIQPSNGFADAIWQAGGVGTVTVMRQDGKPLTKEAIETMWMYASHLLDLFGNGEGPPRRQLTPAGFQGFCKSYKEERVMNNFSSFENMSIPL